MYIITPWPGMNAAFQQVTGYNATTFTLGQPSQSGPNSNITFMYSFPVIVNPFTGTPAVIGAAITPLGVLPLTTNKLVLASNCKLVRSSYPTF